MKEHKWVQLFGINLVQIKSNWMTLKLEGQLRYVTELSVSAASAKQTSSTFINSKDKCAYTDEYNKVASV